MSGPITPADARARALGQRLVVFDVVNDLLAKGRRTITQTEVVEALVARGIDRERIFAEQMLDFEPSYRMRGWKVTYDKPGYNETYSATWTFEEKRKR